MKKGFLWTPLYLNIISGIFALIWMIKDNPTTRKLVVVWLLIDIMNNMIGLIATILIAKWGFLIPIIIGWLISFYLLYLACYWTKWIGAETEGKKFSVVPS
jgi:hypothetical protein